MKLTMDNTFFSQLLSVLGVRHTDSYSDWRFNSMPFRTLFGLTQLLKEYGVESRGVRLQDPSQVALIRTPFVIPVDNRIVIATKACNANLTYLSDGQSMSIPLADFLRAWDGTLLLLSPTAEAKEPDYSSHRLAEVMKVLRNIGLWAVAAAVLVWLMISRGYFSQVSVVLLTLLDLGGIYLSFMLVQKSLGVQNKHADAVCSVLQEGGCDTIAKSEAASFLGIFHWSEVGLVYFSVSLACMLLFPQMMGALALISVCCLPYTIWSISYQYFKAKTWCTMCVGVQATLWLTFFCYLGGGWFTEALPLRWSYLLLCLGYVLTMLGLNRLDSALMKYTKADA